MRRGGLRIMKLFITLTVTTLLMASILVPSQAQELNSDIYKKRTDVESRWISFENPTGAKGAGGRENLGAKGHAFDSLKAGQTREILKVEGSGVIQRMWFTLTDREPRDLRGIRLDMYWDGAETPAVSVPFGDFFGAILGRLVRFENAFYASPEGRSFNCYVPMPFRSGARITLTNESKRDVEKVFYDINYILTDEPDPDALYFHAYWHRVRWTTLEDDFEILPRVEGTGRFLGVHCGVITHPDNVGWWGEGEVKMYVDGDTDLPTIVGTGTEDYIGTGWGQGKFVGRYQGSLVADGKNGQFSFYRYHIPDAIYFQQDLRVTIQQIGGTQKKNVAAMLESGVPIKPVSFDYGDPGRFVKLLEISPDGDLGAHEAPDNAWTNMYRRDDWSAVALFYLDRAENGLPPLQPIEARTEALLEKNPKPR
jgi:D-arabinan exo alpha-(1,3)/(1,5)-arabinofuranosidase (non-reducing end)